MVRPFESPREHLDEVLALVSKLFERQIRCHWELGLLPRVQDEFSGTFVSGDEISAILGGASSGGRPSPEGAERIAALDREIDEGEATIEARLSASLANGQEVPFDRLRTRFALT